MNICELINLAQQLKFKKTTTETHNASCHYAYNKNELVGILDIENKTYGVKEVE